ncbi:MAG: hypothetical protein QW279_02740, partial [Candidatus Jordarchaeaceae archaeon]
PSYIYCFLPVLYPVKCGPFSFEERQRCIQILYIFVKAIRLTGIRLIYKRKLTPSEVKRHFIYVEKEYRCMFPPPGKEFEIIIKKEKINVKTDSRWRIWAALFWDDLPSFHVGDVIVFSKNPNDVFKIEVEK